MLLDVTLPQPPPRGFALDTSIKISKVIPNTALITQVANYPRVQFKGAADNIGATVDKVRQQKRMDMMDADGQYGREWTNSYSYP